MLFFGKIEINEKLLGILVMGLMFCGNAYAGEMSKINWRKYQVEKLEEVILTIEEKGKIKIKNTINFQSI